MQEAHKEIKASVERKDCQEIGENKANKENKDIWVFPVKQEKKENRVSLEEQENQVSLDFQENQEDQEILVCQVK